MRYTGTSRLVEVDPTTPEGRETTRVFNSAGHVLRDQVKGRAAARYEYDGRGRFKTLKRGQKFASILAGPTFDSFDTISLSEELPELDVGDVV